MLVAELTPYGQSVVSTHVTIDGIILLSEYLLNIGSLTDISSYTTLLDIDACGNINKSDGYVNVEDTSESIYQARTLLFYSLSGTTKNIVAGCSKSDPIINKTKSSLDIQLPVNLSCFTNGFTFAAIQSGYHTASNGIAGIVHIDDPSIESDDSYSVYSKSQIDGLISGFAKYSDIPTNVSVFNNDAGYISQIKTINNQSLIGTGDITITSGGGDYATYIGNSEANYVAYSNNVASNGKALLPYADAADSVGYVDLGSSTNRWRNAYIKDAIYLSDSSASIKGYTNLLRLHTQSDSSTQASITNDIADTHFHVYSYTGTDAALHIEHDLIDASSAGISLYNNHVTITSTETAFNKDADLVLAKDTNTYIVNEAITYVDSLTVDYEYDSNDDFIGLRFLSGDNTSWSKLILLSELDEITPVGELVYIDASNRTINQTNVTASLKDILDEGPLNIVTTGLYVDGTIDNSTTLGVFCGIYTSYSNNELLFIIQANELSLDSYEYIPYAGQFAVFNNNSTYSISNDYQFTLKGPVKISIQDYVENSFSDICTLSTDQTITSNKTFSSNVYIPTSAGSNLYVTGYADGAGIRFGDNDTSVSYPMIVGETMSSTRCDLRQNYYVNNTLAGTIQTQCDSDGNLITTSGLGRSNSTTGKWSLGTSDYHLSSVYADNFHGDLSGNAATATEATTATYSQYIKYGTSTNYPMYASSSTVLRPTLDSSVDIGTSSYRYKNVYADFYNGFPIIPFGTCDSASSSDKTVTLSPAPSSLTTGMIICVQFSSTNTKSSPTLNVNALGAKLMYRTSSSAVGTNIATSWPAGSRVLFRYSGSSWSMLSKVDYQTSTASNTNIIPSTNNSYDIGSTDYKWQNLYITGGHSSRYIVIDNNGGEPTIRPDIDNYGYLGSSNYHWYKLYTNNLHVGSNAVQLPPISAAQNTSLGSIQFLRVAIPANTTTGIRNAGTALSSSSYTLMLVTASTGATYLSFRNNTAPSGTWTTLTDMYYYNSTSSVVYTYVLAYKSA